MSTRGSSPGGSKVAVSLQELAATPAQRIADFEFQIEVSKERIAECAEVIVACMRQISVHPTKLHFVEGMRAEIRRQLEKARGQRVNIAHCRQEIVRHNEQLAWQKTQPCPNLD